MSSLYISELSAVSSNLSAQSLIIGFSADPIPAHPPSADSTNEAVSADIWHHIEQFKAALQQEKMKTCHCCNEHWFQMSLKDDICAACVQDERKHASNDSFLFSDANCLNPGPVSTHLSALSEIEK